MKKIWSAHFFSRISTYVYWLVISTIFLVVAYLIDPYVFAYVALGLAWINVALILWILIVNWRMGIWALITTLPTVYSLWLLSNFNWA